MSKRKPKEFFFNFKIGPKESCSQEQIVWCMKNGRHDFHVIEYYAFTQLQVENERLKKRLEIANDVLIKNNGNDLDQFIKWREQQKDEGVE